MTTISAVEDYMAQVGNVDRSRSLLKVTGEKLPSPHNHSMVGFRTKKQNEPPSEMLDGS